MVNKLKEHFPMLRDREEVKEIIQKDEKLKLIFESWEGEKQQEFLDLCTGAKGLKIMYDPYFKEAVNPEYYPERLEEFLSITLKRKVKICNILPNDSTRISDETSLLITDIIVELEDGSIANVEIQKIGYYFPGERSACYSADMLLRQYKRTRERFGKNFFYYQIKNVYLIVLFERSPKEFKAFPSEYLHHSKQIFNSGLQLKLLQEYIMIPLDIFHKTMQNKTIDTPLEAWLTFLSSDNPEKITELITKFPEFKPMYETLYQMCRNVEDIMGFFSEELRILDRNTVKYMIEDQDKQLKEQEKMLKENEIRLKESERQIEEKDTQIKEKETQIKEKDTQIKEKDTQIKEKDTQIQMLMKQLEAYKK